MTILTFNGVPIEVECPECHGITKMHELLGFMRAERCYICNNIGTIPTEDGANLLRFMKKHKRMFGYMKKRNEQT